ncbi:MAG: hypothetical protein ACPF9D_04880, partial [Owenweeksia sp.]
MNKIFNTRLLVSLSLAFMSITSFAQDLYADLKKVRQAYFDQKQFEVEVEYQELQKENTDSDYRIINSMPLKYVRYNHVLLSEMAGNITIQDSSTQLVIIPGERIIQVLPSTQKGFFSTILPIDSL